MSNTETFSSNKAFDATIKHLLTAFDTDSQRRMRKAIRDAGKAAAKHQDENTDAAARHIVREFIPAYALNVEVGYNLKYEVKIGGKTPDWLETEAKLLMDGYTFERGGSSTFPERVLNAISVKCSKYDNIANQEDLSIIISTHLDFFSGADLEDCQDKRKDFASVFDNFPRLRGILFFAEEIGGIVMGSQPYGFRFLTRSDLIDDGVQWPFPIILSDKP